MGTGDRADSRKTTPGDSRGEAPPAAPERLVAEQCALGLLLSRDRRVAWCNQRFADLFGYPREALVGQSLAVLYPSLVEFQRIGDRGLKVMLDQGEYHDERLMRRRDGTLGWFRVHGRASDREHPFDEAVWSFEPLAGGAEAAQLTPREREVLAAMAQGQTAKQSARELGLSPRTVEKLRASLRERFRVRNAAELMSRVGGLPGTGAGAGDSGR